MFLGSVGCTGKERNLSQCESRDVVAGGECTVGAAGAICEPGILGTGEDLLTLSTHTY